jgi:hypothetical protein
VASSRLSRPSQGQEGHPLWHFFLMILWLSCRIHCNLLRLLRWGRLRKRICGTHGSCFPLGRLLWTSPGPTDLRITGLPFLYNRVFSTATTVSNSQGTKTSRDASGLFYFGGSLGAHRQTDRPTPELQIYLPKTVTLHVTLPVNVTAPWRAVTRHVQHFDLSTYSRAHCILAPPTAGVIHIQ